MTHAFPVRLPCRGLAILLVLAATLVGCAGVRYEPVKADSPRPQTAVHACSGSLKVNQRCLARVQADQFYTSTGLNVERGQTYKVEVPPEQVWYDADRRNVPPKGDAGSAFMNLGARLKRHDVKWFTLMAAVTDPRMTHSLGDSHDIHANPVIEIKHDGVLAMYPNDALPFYGNNSGQIWVFIERLAD